MTYNYFVMKIFLSLSLAITLKTAVASLEVSSFSHDQICMMAKDPPLSVQVTYEINKRKISCNDGIVVNQSEISINKNSARTLKFKKWNKALRVPSTSGVGMRNSAHSFQFNFVFLKPASLIISL